MKIPRLNEAFRIGPDGTQRDVVVRPEVLSSTLSPTLASSLPEGLWKVKSKVARLSFQRPRVPLRGGFDEEEVAIAIDQITMVEQVKGTHLARLQLAVEPDPEVVISNLALAAKLKSPLPLSLRNVAML